MRSTEFFLLLCLSESGVGNSLSEVEDGVRVHVCLHVAQDTTALKFNIRKSLGET